MNASTRSRFAIMEADVVIERPFRPSLLTRIKWKLDDYFFPEGIEDPRHARLFYTFMLFCIIGSTILGTVNVLS
jgi:hypothetical protein